MTITSIIPKYGSNYDLGFLGFTFVGGTISKGIAYFERWERLSDITVSHCFVVTGPGECVEAHIDTGVAEAQLCKYFDDPNTQVFFRKPRSLTPKIQTGIISAAISRVGCQYATDLIIADALADTMAGHFLNWIFKGWPKRTINRVFDYIHPNQFICSQLAAFALASQPEYKGTGCLKQPLDTIDPQQLFEDQVIFEPWANKKV